MAYFHSGRVKLIENEICALSEISPEPATFYESKLNKELQKLQEEFYFPCQITIPSLEDYWGVKKFLGNKCDYWLKDHFLQDYNCYYTVDKAGGSNWRSINNKNTGVVLCVIFDIGEIESFIEGEKKELFNKLSAKRSFLKETNILKT